MTLDHAQDAPALGAPVPDWRPPLPPARAAQEGRWCRIEPLDAAAHLDQLHAAYMAPDGVRVWDYLPYGPFAERESYAAWLRKAAARADPMFFAIRAKAGVDGAMGPALGVASYLRIDPDSGSIEVGHISYSPALQRSVAATEAMYLMMRAVFEGGYRRYEWKCNALNATSRRAAQRLGFSYEGVFRQAAVVKGRNRDTAWYAAIDSEWPRLRTAFETWLAPENFDASGRQRWSLSALTAPVLVAKG